jgi:hypothetical protein
VSYVLITLGPALPTHLSEQVGHQPELGLDHLGKHFGRLVLAVIVVQPGNTERLGSVKSGLPVAKGDQRDPVST